MLRRESTGVIWAPWTATSQPSRISGERGQVLDLNLTRITGPRFGPAVLAAGRGDWSAVAMVSPPEDEEFGRFTDRWPAFLGKLDLGAPEILRCPNRTTPF